MGSSQVSVLEVVDRNNSCGIGIGRSSGIGSSNVALLVVVERNNSCDIGIGSSNVAVLVLVAVM